MWWISFPCLISFVSLAYVWNWIRTDLDVLQHFLDHAPAPTSNPTSNPCWQHHECTTVRDPIMAPLLNDNSTFQHAIGLTNPYYTITQQFWIAAALVLPLLTTLNCSCHWRFPIYQRNRTKCWLGLSLIPALGMVLGPLIVLWWHQNSREWLVNPIDDTALKLKHFDWCHGAIWMGGLHLDGYSPANTQCETLSHVDSVHPTMTMRWCCLIPLLRASPSLQQLYPRINQFHQSLRTGVIVALSGQGIALLVVLWLILVLIYRISALPRSPTHLEYSLNEPLADL